jgi:fructan beta-fructosidase
MRARPVFLVLVLVLAAALVLRPVTPAWAGVAADYPEFPYPPSRYDEPHRGQFHFSPRGGWMNDVNAPLYHDGVYHLFFQHNPHGLAWDTMHWGHATSTDLVHWTQRPIALEPGVHPGDLWSGGGVVDTANTSGLGAGGAAPIVVFTGTDGVSVAYSTDGARTFQPYDGGRKVITMPAHSRDPKVLWHAPTRRWVMVVWSDAGGNAAHVYTSPNLLDWTFRSRFAADWLVECPDLFPLRVDGTGPEKWVLTDASGEYVVGAFDGERFTAEQAGPQRMDHGRTSFEGSFYGGLTFSGMPDGRTVQMVWMPGNRGAGWTGSASFPAELGLRSYPEGLRVTRTPVAEIAALRAGTREWSGRTVYGADDLDGVTADTYELTAEFDVASSTAARFGLRLHARADGGYDRAVTYDRAAGTLDGAPLPAVDGRIRLRVLVDRGQLEIFGNDGRLSLTETVAFDSSPGSRGIRLFADGGTARLVSLRLHPLRSAWTGGTESTLDGLPGRWRAAGGTWTDVTGGKRGEAAGDGFYLSERTGADFTYEADVRLDTATAAALTFRASPDAATHYSVNVDAGGFVKLWRPGRDIAVHATPVTRGRTYHLRVVARGPRITVYLDHGAVPVVDATDSAHASGHFGLNVFDGAAVLQNAFAGAPGFGSSLAGPWRPVSGTWTMPGSGLLGRRTGDGFLVAEQAGGDFTYEADIRIVAGRAAALTFRAGADATTGYTATLDTDGVVKLWRPGEVLATAPATVAPGRTYHLTVVADGPRLRVHLDRAANPVIDVVDGTYAAGRFGLNVFDATAHFSGVTVR